VSSFASGGGRRLSLSECPVSAISGESVALIEDFLAQLMFPSPIDVRRWPARRVDAFALLYRELREIEGQKDAES
jgi:hypothetical protein